MARYEVEKPWGLEEILELNDQYMMKRLHMKAGHKCSLQSHTHKHETFTLISGEMRFWMESTIGMVPIMVKPGDAHTIPPGVKHRMEAITDIVYIECSTPHPDDVNRFEDDYARTDSD